MEFHEETYGALMHEDVSPGPKLMEFASDILREVDELDLEDCPEDRIHEIADGAVPTYTRDMLEIVCEDLSLLSRESELGPAYDGKPTIVNLAAAILYDVAYNIASVQLQERQNENE